jgi:hypothetical protein
MPIEIAPAMSSATPPTMTSLDSPRDERPAVRANGTVRPSESPITLLETDMSKSAGMHFPPYGNTGQRYLHVTNNVRVYELTFILSL